MEEQTYRYNFLCLNVKCESKEVKKRVTETESGAVTSFGSVKEIEVRKPESERDTPTPCPYCEKPLKLIGTLGISLQNRFNSLSLEGRRDMLKKRSRQDYKKNISEAKREMIKGAKIG